jgi:hypothetical protein
MIKNTKAQYYLMAAAIIVVVLLGMSVATNYLTTKDEPKKFYDLGDELKEECARIIDYGIYNEVNVTDLIGIFVQEDLLEYIGQKDLDVDFVFIYGEKENIKVVTSINNTLIVGRVGYDTVFEDVDADYVCDGQTIGSLNDLDNQNILLKNNCQVTGNIGNIDNSNLKINSSTVTGNINVLTNTNFELIHSTVNGKVDIMGSGNKFIINNTIDDTVKIVDGKLFITDNVIHGKLETQVGHCPEVQQIGDNIVDGGISLCRGADIDIIVKIYNNTYSFESQQGINCFFVLAKEEGGEIYILESDKL